MIRCVHCKGELWVVMVRLEENGLGSVRVTHVQDDRDDQYGRKRGPKVMKDGKCKGMVWDQVVEKYGTEKARIAVKQFCMRVIAEHTGVPG
jgi:hypothetical protein